MRYVKNGKPIELSVLRARWAHQWIRDALRDGRIVKPSNCSKCSKQSVRLDAHHHDYNKPLEVEWLCRKCHLQLRGALKTYSKNVF